VFFIKKILLLQLFASLDTPWPPSPYCPTQIRLQLLESTHSSATATSILHLVQNGAMTSSVAAKTDMMVDGFIL
jgi:hypothetical protein